MIGRRVYGVFALTAVLPAVVIVACYGPTQVRLTISTDVPCRLEEPRLQTDIRVGASFAALHPETTAYSCIVHQGADSEIGSLVMVPSGDHDGRVSVEVALDTLGGPATRCTKDALGRIPPTCIVARRSFKYIDHSSRTLPIPLTLDCLGLSCFDESQTCIRGKCQFADVDVNPCAASGAPESCADSGTAPIGGDASIADATASDAGDAGDAGTPPAVRCMGPTGGTLTPAPGEGVRPTLLLGANSKNLYWNGSAADGTAAVYEISKDGGAPIPISLGINFITADDIKDLAVDDDNLWVVASGAVRKYRLSDRTLVMSHNVPSLNAVALGNEGTYYASASTLGLIAKSGNVAPLPGSAGGARLVVSPARAYVYGPAPDGSIKRHPLPWDGGTGYTIAYDGALRFFAPVDGGLILTTGGSEPSLKRINNTATTPTFLQSAIAPGAVAVQGKNVFYVETGADAGINAGIVKTVDTETPDKVMVAAGFSTIQGLVVDDACVYFWGTKSGTSALHVAPQNPNGQAPDGG